MPSVKVSASEIVSEFDPINIPRKELVLTQVRSLTIQAFCKKTFYWNKDDLLYESIQKLRIQLPTKPETILNLTFPYSCICLLKDIKCQMVMGLHAEQGNIVITSGRCKVLRHEMMIFTYILLLVPKRRLFSTKKKIKKLLIGSSIC